MSSTVIPPLSPSVPPRVFGGHPLHTDGDLLALGIAADGTLWSVEEPGALRRWNLSTRRQLVYYPLEELATLWAFNWAARLIAATSDEINVYEAGSGQTLAGWSTPSWVTAVAFQPGAPVLASGHDDHVVRVWDWATTRLIHELRGHDRSVSAVAFSTDGTRLASAGEEKLIRIWDVRTGALLGTLEGHTDRIPALVWHPDGRRIFSAGWDTTVRVWDTETFEPIILLNSHATQVHAVALSPDGSLLASADSANAVHIWETEQNRTRSVIPEQAGEIRCLVFSPDGSRLAWGGADRVIHLWDIRKGVDRVDGADPMQSRTLLAISGDGTRLFSLGAGTELRVWDIAGGQPVLDLEASTVLHAFACSPDGRWIAGSRGDAGNEEDRSTLSLWRSDTGKHQAVLDGQRAPITALAFASDSTLVASAGFRSSDVWLWNVPSGEPALLIPDAVDDCSVEALAFHPNRRLLAVGGIDWMATSGIDGQVGLWDVDGRKAELILPGGALALAFHPDGRYLALATLVQSVRVWDLIEDRPVLDLLGHLEPVTCLAYSPDGRWLASGSDDRTVRLWDAATGESCAAAELDTQIKSLVFSPDGRTLFTGNANTSCYQLEVDQMLAPLAWPGTRSSP